VELAASFFPAGHGLCSPCKVGEDAGAATVKVDLTMLQAAMLAKVSVSDGVDFAPTRLSHLGDGSPAEPETPHNDHTPTRLAHVGDNIASPETPCVGVAPFWCRGLFDEGALPLPPLPMPTEELQPPMLLGAAIDKEMVKPGAAFPDAATLKGRRIHLCLAPDQAAQEALSVAADGAGSAWVKRWGGWHVPVGRPVLAESVDAMAALTTAAGESEKAICPWLLRSVQYSLRVHKWGIGLPCFCQSLLRHVTRDEAVWLGPSKQLMAIAEQLQRLGWSKVEAKDFRLTLGPREEVRHALPDLISALWDARWVWVIAIEQPDSHQFTFHWASAKPAMIMPA